MCRLVILSLLFLSSAAYAVETSQVAPAWERTDLNGNLVRYPPVDTELNTVLLFWASWCPYCKVLMPHLKDIQDEYGRDKIRIVAVNMKETDETSAINIGNSYRLMTILNGDDIGKDYGVKFLPGLFVVNDDGVVVFRRAWTELPADKAVAELWAEQIRSALGPAY
jgi:cytochrome c biogenesis protein CcmG/thiol:disulfide interchange protein DsbE